MQPLSAKRALRDNRAAELARQVAEDKRLFGRILHTTEFRIEELAAEYDADGRQAGRVVPIICAIGVTVAAACFAAAAFLPLPARAAETGNTPSRFAIYAIDNAGGEWIVGSGDSCQSAADNIKWPPVVVSEVECAPYELESAR